MKNKSIMMAAAIAVLMSISSAVQAIPIAGSIGFTGEYTQNGGTLGDLRTATSMNITTAEIGTKTGAFVGATLVSFASPIAVNPGTGLTTLWSVLVGSVTYTFTATSEVQDLTTRNAIHLSGTGVISDGNVANNTAGNWQLGFGRSGESFQWQSTGAADDAPTSRVPDAGSSAMMLGAGFFGLCLFRNKVKASKATA